MVIELYILVCLVFKSNACPYSIHYINKTIIAQSDNSACVRCEDLREVVISNTPHEACRLTLVNDYDDCKNGSNTLIESTSKNAILYYDISLVDGITCMPHQLYEENELIDSYPQCNSEVVCGNRICASECSVKKDVHECELTLPYTVNWENKLRSTCLSKDTKVYTSAYDDYRGLRSSNSSHVSYKFNTDNRKIYRSGSNFKDNTVLRTIVSSLVFFLILYQSI